MDSPVRGSGSGAGSSVGVAVEAICSGVRGIGQGSFRLTAHEDKYRAGTILPRNTRLHEVARHNKTDMVVCGSGWRLQCTGATKQVNWSPEIEV